MLNCGTEGRKTQVHASTGKLQDSVQHRASEEVQVHASKRRPRERGDFAVYRKAGRETCNLHSHNYH